MGLNEVKRHLNDLTDLDYITRRMHGYMHLDDQLLIEHHLLGVPLNQEELILMAESTFSDDKYFNDPLNQLVFQLNYTEFTSFLDYARNKYSLPKMYPAMSRYSRLIKKARPSGYVPSAKAQVIIMAVFALIVIIYSIIVAFLEPIPSYIALGFTIAAIVTFYLIFNKVRRIDEAKSELDSLKEIILTRRERRLESYL